MEYLPHYCPSQALVAMLKRVNRRYHDVVTGAAAAAEVSARAARRPPRESWGRRLRNLAEDVIDDFQVGRSILYCKMNLTCHI